jgi:hypothetical protein
MIEAYMKATEDVLRLAGQMFLRRMDDQLRWFAEDLHDFIYELDRNPRRDWRERFDAFLADQASRDRVITPESRKELIVYLEMWERNVYGGPPEPKPALQTVVTRIEEPTVVDPETASASEIPSVLPPRKLAGADKPAGWWPFGGETVDFYRKLNDARGCIYDIERMLPAIASQIANAKEGEPLEIDDELNAIDTLIWRHNDLLESAREIWLREDLGSTEFAELDLGPTPVSLGLPLFTDDQQAARAKAQLQKIGTRLKQKIAFLDNVIFAMEVLETAGTIASFALGAGVIVNAAIQGGKVVLIKTVAKMAAAAVAGELIGQATNAALNAAGLEDEQIAQVQGAVEIISTVLQLRRMGKLKTNKLRPSSPTQGTPSQPVSPGKTDVPEHPVGPNTPVRISRERTLALKPSKGGTGPRRWQRVPKKPNRTRPHGNSLQAKGDHVVYVVTDKATGKVLRFGETGRKLAARSSEWRRFFAKRGIEIDIQPVGTTDSKAAARKLETRYIDAFTRLFGIRPTFNLSDH